MSSPSQNPNELEIIEEDTECLDPNASMIMEDDDVDSELYSSSDDETLLDICVEIPELYPCGCKTARNLKEVCSSKIVSPILDTIPQGCIEYLLLLMENELLSERQNAENALSSDEEAANDD